MDRQAWSLIAVNPLSNWPRTSCGSTPGSTWPPAAFRLSLPRWFQYLRRWQATIVAGFTKISVSRQFGQVLDSHAGGCGLPARYEDAYRISGTPRTGVEAPGVPWAAVQRPPFLLTSGRPAREPEPATPPLALSKSEFLGGLQCTKLLRHLPNSPESFAPEDDEPGPPAEQGRQVGLFVRDLLRHTAAIR